mgnify:CR=1 FL=1
MDNSRGIGIVFLHGSGDTGAGFCEWLEEASDSFSLQQLDALNISYRFPSASPMPYTLDGGCLSKVWHDRYDLKSNSTEDVTGIQTSMDLIDEEIDYLINTKDIPCQNIFLWGLSMGGHMALQAIALSRHAPDLAGIIGLSCYLSTTSQVWTLDPTARRIPPIKMVHGEADDLIPYAWGLATSEMLVERLQADVIFSTIPDLSHDMCDAEVADVMRWILSLY